MVNVPFNIMQEPPPTAPPIMFDAPLDLTWGRREIWIVAAGGEHWGGCEIWGSVNDQSFDKFGTVGHGAVAGSLTSGLPSSADPDETSSFSVDVALSQGTLFPGSREDADKLVTLCRVGEEFIAYSAARLMGPYFYNLDGYIRRGCLRSTIAEHAAGTPFARLNQAVFRFEYPPTLAGSTIYVKLPAFNQFNEQLQGLDEVRSYSLTLSP